MKVSSAQLSTTGPVRRRNEDSCVLWQSDDPTERAARGALAVIADGLGSGEAGDEASDLATKSVLRAFQEADVVQPPAQVLGDAVRAAALAVHEASLQHQGRMGTTLTAAILRHDTVVVAHVGDCRSYLVHDRRSSLLTRDHTYAAVQMKLGLVTAEQAARSGLRNMVTRSLGADPFVQADFRQATLHAGDVLVQCCDGVHGCVSDEEIADAVMRHDPEEACQFLVSLAERRGSEDNISVQVIRVDEVPNVLLYKGVKLVQPTVSRRRPGIDLAVGDVLDDRFEVLDPIARSGMATIWKAADRTSGKTVVLKVPLFQYESDPGFSSRFDREERIGRVLDHPYVIKVLAVEKKSRPYIVMEYLEGETLERLMRTVHPLPPGDAVHIAVRICDALDYMHGRNVVHRDLKPQNVVLCGDGSIRVIDFGIAKAAALPRLTFGSFSPTIGTPDYMAPEQVKGARGDERTDIYSLGAMLYEMLTGRVPFPGNNIHAVMNARTQGDPVPPRQVNPAISAALEEIVLHAMERDPEKRYPSAEALRRELEDPQHVEITGRAARVQLRAEPSASRGALQPVILALAAPFVLMLLAILWMLLAHHH
jgi:serine/threonine-protein kinase